MTIVAILALAVVAWAGDAYGCLILVSDEFGAADFGDARLTQNTPSSKPPSLPSHRR